VVIGTDGNGSNGIFSNVICYQRVIRQLTENETFQAAVLANTAFVLSASHGSDFFPLRSPQRPLA
jgi:hypothetical protein